MREIGKLEFIMIKNLLDKNDVTYKVMEHSPVSTSEEAAAIRGVELRTGVKALLLKTSEGKIILGLAAADRRFDLKKFAKIVKTKKLGMASSQEVFKITKCKPGCVHPFGNLFKTATYMDESVLENPHVNFSVGIHTASISMKSRDLVNILKPRIVQFT